jgi:hypothetical protein
LFLISSQLQKTLRILRILLLLFDPNYPMNLLLHFVQRIHSIQRILLHPFDRKNLKNQKIP